MTEQELIKKIEESAENIVIPKELEPEEIKEKLKEQKEKKKSKNNKNNKNKKRRWFTVAATAAIVTFCAAGSFAVYEINGNIEKSESVPESAVMEAQANEESDKDENLQEDVALQEETVAEENAMQSRRKKTDAGKMYVVAGNYEKVYDMLKQYEEKPDQGFGSLFGIDIDGEAKQDSTGDLAEESVSSEQSAASGSYSQTNLQVEGVDESDIVKTDGSYIYIVRGKGVTIMDVRNGEMKMVGQIEATEDEDMDQILEMYVDGDTLNLITEGEREDFTRETEDCYKPYQAVTRLLTYDISDRKNPVLEGTVLQDGYYKSSRKIDDIVYLFTTEYGDIPDYSKRKAVQEENLKNWIPFVNGKIVPADSIYISKEGRSQFLISSVDIKDPENTIDETLIYNANAEIYVTKNAIYLYRSDYGNRGTKTRIAKFSMEDGVIDAMATASIAGTVKDTFAINEYEGKLRVLTTNRKDGTDENNLYLLDENLELTGKLGKIAKGEQIYAARFLKDTAYFVTYKNTDPLFAVDLSDDENPKILSELKITGFSEYLHFWGEDKLIGIGYETDEETGQQQGIKLSMFDISDPSKVEVINSCVLEKASYSPALYDYKGILVDAEENIIAFPVQNSFGETLYEYQVFSFEDDEFKSQLVQSLDIEDGVEGYRGIYIGDTLYVINAEKIASYNRANGYQLIDKQKFDKWKKVKSN